MADTGGIYKKISAEMINFCRENFFLINCSKECKYFRDCNKLDCLVDEDNMRIYPMEL